MQAVSARAPSSQIARRLFCRSPRKADPRGLQAVWGDPPVHYRNRRLIRDWRRVSCNASACAPLHLSCCIREKQSWKRCAPAGSVGTKFVKEHLVADRYTFCLSAARPVRNPGHVSWPILTAALGDATQLCSLATHLGLVTASICSS